MIKLVNRSPFFVFFAKRLSSISVSKTGEPKSNFMTNYLISTFGFSLEQATVKSRELAHISSTETPNSVGHFLEQNGYSEKDIKSIVSRYSTILRYNVEKVLEPHYKALKEIGHFSESDLHKIVTHNPQILANRYAILKIEFLRSFLHNDNKKLTVVLVKNIGLIGQNIDKSINPKISLFYKYGLSKEDIGNLLVGGSLFRRSVETIEMVLKDFHELGFVHGSSHFVRGLISFSKAGIDSFKEKKEIFKDYDWSEEEFLSAFRKAPNIIDLSSKSIQKKMDFFYGKAGCEKPYIVSNPSLLYRNLEKRLLPRYCMIKILKSKKLFGHEMAFSTMMIMTERKFVEKFIVQNMQKVPELHEIYNAACAGQVTI